MFSDSQLKLKIRLLSLLSMIMVVYVHAYTLDFVGYTGAVASQRSYNSFIQDLISHGVGRVATPFYFIIAGYLFFSGFKLKPSDILQKYKRRVRTLLLPFILWSAYGICLYFMLQLVPQFKPFFTNRIIQDLQATELLKTLLLNPIPYQLWFLRDLMVLVLLSPAIWLVVRFFKEGFILLLLAAWFLDYDFVYFTSVSVLFFSVGCLFTLRPGTITYLQTNHQYQIPLLFWIGLLVFKTEMAYLGIADAVTLKLLHKLAILWGLYAVWIAVNAIADKERTASRAWLYTSVSSFFIYAFHEPLLTILKRGLLYMIHTDKNFTSLTVYLLAPCLTILICVLVAGLLMRRTPRLFNVLTGYRNTTSLKPSADQQSDPEQLIKTYV